MVAAFGTVAAGTCDAHIARTPAEACVRLEGMTIPAERIGAPSRGATVRSSKLMWPMSLSAGTSQPNDGGLSASEYCEVTGEIAAVDPNAPPILFQVNLPTRWNSKALHMGGAGFDGAAVTGLGQISRAPASTLKPIARNYVTFGSDGGHEGNDASFAMNAEALANFAGVQLKKTHDVAMAIVKRRYGKRPERTYFVGQSEGGREGLLLAQRYPEDYDGVAVTAPAMSVMGAILRFNAVATATSQPGAFLSPGKVKTFSNAVLAQCDLDDGVTDGVVGNFLGCAFDRTKLRCPEGVDTGDSCLSDAQLASLNAMYNPMAWRDGAGKLISASPRYLLGGSEDQPGALGTWILGRAPVPRDQPAGDAFSPRKLGIGPGPFFGVSGVRYMIVKNPAFNTTDFNPQRYAERIRQLEKAFSASNPNLLAFFRRGGKLIVLHNTSDPAISPVSSIEYYDSVRRLLGAAIAGSSMRLYIVPAGGHGGEGNVPTRVDILGMLDDWVSRARAPDEKWVAEEDGPDGRPTRTKPLCAYPDYPRYRGSGDPQLAASYSCVVSRPE